MKKKRRRGRTFPRLIHRKMEFSPSIHRVIHTVIHQKSRQKDRNSPCYLCHLIGREDYYALDRRKRASYYRAQIWDDSRAVRGVFAVIRRYNTFLKGSYHISHAEDDEASRHQEGGQDCQSSRNRTTEVGGQSAPAPCPEGEATCARPGSLSLGRDPGPGVDSRERGRALFHPHRTICAAAEGSQASRSHSDAGGAHLLALQRQLGREAADRHGRSEERRVGQLLHLLALQRQLGREAADRHG